MANTTLIWNEVNQIIIEKKKFDNSFSKKIIEKFDNKKSYQNLILDQFKHKLKKKYNNLSTKFPTIFEKTINGTMDMNRLKFMLNMINKVNNNEITEHNASVQIGEKLVNEYVKPMIDKLETKNK